MIDPKKPLYAWFRGLIENKPNLEVISPSSFLEDGMSFDDYLQYEIHHFHRLKNSFDIDTNFRIEIIKTFHLTENKSINYIYFFNKYNRIAFKMTVTLLRMNDHFLITGNDFYSQIVTKHRLNHCIYKDKIDIVGTSAAINTKRDILNIISPNIKIDGIRKGSNYKNDGFMYLHLRDKEGIRDIETLYIRYKDKTEKRTIFFDPPLISFAPYKISKGYIHILNDRYPVHLFYIDKNNIAHNHEYPRDICVRISDIKKITITDNLDNDWSIETKK